MPITNLAQAIARSRRGDTRRKLDLDLAGETSSGAASVTVLNLSATGALLRTPNALRVGERLRLTLPDGAIAGATVQWAGDDLYGCRFDHAISRATASAAELRARFGPAPGPPSAGAETLGARIKRLRKARGLTLAGLGEQVGVSKPTVWKWETDQVHPRQAAVAALAVTLAVAEVELVYGASERPDPDPLIETTDAAALSHALNHAREAMAALTGVEPDRIEVTVSIRA